MINSEKFAFRFLRFDPKFSVSFWMLCKIDYLNLFYLAAKRIQKILQVFS